MAKGNASLLLNWILNFPPLHIVAPKKFGIGIGEIMGNPNFQGVPRYFDIFPSDLNYTKKIPKNAKGKS